MQCTIESFNAHLRANPGVIDSLMSGKFNLDALTDGARKLGFDVGLTDLNAYFEEKYSGSASEAGTTFYVQDEDVGEFRELTQNEVDFVGGGTTAVAAVIIVYVAAVVAAAAMMVSYAMAAQVIAVGGWIVVAAGVFVAGHDAIQ